MTRKWTLREHVEAGSFRARRDERLLLEDSELLLKAEPPVGPDSSERELARWYRHVKIVVLIRAARASSNPRERRMVALDFERLARGDDSGFRSRFPSVAAYAVDWRPNVGLGVSLYDGAGELLFDEPPSIAA